jgi:DNA-directed RNA polymerase specialized sigma24 family protein
MYQAPDSGSEVDEVTMAQGQVSPQDSLTHLAAKEGAAGLNDMFDRIGAGLYTLASMLVGEGEESIKLVERAVATADVAPRTDIAEAIRNSQLALCRAAIEVLERRSPGSLAAPIGSEPARTCIEDDDLEAAGVSRDELSMMIAGPDRDRLRTWLAGLPDALRVVFVLRAVGGMSSRDTASLLPIQARPLAAIWTAESVREVFRQALCSLASQLIHANTAK